MKPSWATGRAEGDGVADLDDGTFDEVPVDVVVGHHHPVDGTADNMEVPLQRW